MPLCSFAEFLRFLQENRGLVQMFGVLVLAVILSCGGCCTLLCYLLIKKHYELEGEKIRVRELRSQTEMTNLEARLDTLSLNYDTLRRERRSAKRKPDRTQQTLSDSEIDVLPPPPPPASNLPALNYEQ